MNTRTHTLLLTRHDGQARSLAFNPRRAGTALAAALLCLAGGLLFSGFHFGVQHEARSQLAEVDDLRRLTLQQQQALATARTDARDHLDALAVRLGRMQAEVLRLESLGTRLVDIADLDAGEFDFAIAPPVGGPGDAQPATDNDVSDFLAALDELDATLGDREHKLDLLARLLAHRQLSRRVTPSGHVVRNGLLSSRFGMRIDPFTGKKERHKGIDIAARAGSEILAAGDGVVAFAGERNGYGNLVEVNHGNGIVTRYAHNRSIIVNTGDTIRKHQPLALLGNTGRSTGPHVHVEVLRDGAQVNPARYVEH